MAIWESLGKKVSGTTATAVQQAKVLTETTKLNGLIADEKKNIDNLYHQIGRLYATIHHDDYEENFTYLMTNLIGSEKKIEDYQAQIQDIKGLVTCTGCGAQLQQDAVFCSVCGTPVPKKVEPVVEQKPAPAGNLCPNCGNVVPAGARFCTGCGTPVVEKKPEPAAAPKAVPAEDPETTVGVPAAVPELEEERTVMVRRTCANCGARLEEDTVFCTECGSRAW